MEDVKRWSVTYTKHVKQKRKVYQDGSLHLLRNNKVILYDESEQLLDIKFLTKNEAVRSGHSLEFASFLVDIGDPERDDNPISHPNPKSKYDNVTSDKPGFTPRKNQRNTFNTRKPNTVGKLASAINISPSQKIIKEFKKKELLKYGVQKSPSSATAPSFREWEVLYTSQITKKAKKYHDGFLRMVFCGSWGRQIVLYDLNKNQLDKRFLKKDEIITTGESVTFDNHLVDIGDPMGTNEGNTEVKIDGINCKITNKRDKVADSRSSSGGHPQQDACSGKPVNSNLHSLKADKMNLAKRLPSHTPLRDAYQILSVLKKPVAQVRSPTAEKNPAKQCPSKYSELIQLDSVCHDVEGSLAVPVDPCLEKTAGNKNKKAVNEGYRTSSECSGDRSDVELYDLPTPAVNAGRRCNKIEAPVSSQKIEANYSAVESFNETEQEVKFTQCNRLQAKFDHSTSVTLQTSRAANFLSTESNEAEAHHRQRLTTISETDTTSEGQLAQDLSRAKCSSNDPGTTEMNCSVKIKDLHQTLDYPSFDLGF